MSEAAKRDRSPQFPYIGLTKAIDRINTLNAKVKRHEARVADIAKDWGLTPTSSSTDRTVAALISYGLVEDCGGSKLTRKIKLSDAGWRILEDQRPGVREKALSEAAMRPRIIQDYSNHWRGGRPDDGHALSQLKFEGGFTDDGAGMFLRVFDDAMRYTSGPAHDINSDKPEEQDAPPAVAQAGDLVQWTSGGVDQFPAPRRVVAVSEDRQWLWVEGSQTGIAMSEVEVVGTAGAPATPPPPPAAVAAALAVAAAGAGHDASPSGSQEDKFSLDEGVVTIRFPENMTEASVDELEEFFALFIKKAKRRAKPN